MMKLKEAGKLMREKREYHRMSQKMLGDILGCDQKTIHRIETESASDTRFNMIVIEKFERIFAKNKVSRKPDVSHKKPKQQVNSKPNELAEKHSENPLSENEMTDALWSSFSEFLEDEKAKFLLAALRGCQR